MDSSQFETLMLAITGLRTELKSEIGRLESKMDTSFTEVRKKMHMGLNITLSCADHQTLST